jgi:CRISPR-associated protein Csb1
MTTLALFKVQRFLKLGLRLRTACDLEPVDGIKVTRPDTFKLPDEKAIKDAMQSALSACIKEKQFADPAVTKVVFEEKAAKKKKEEIETEEDE